MVIMCDPDMGTAVYSGRWSEVVSMCGGAGKAHSTLNV